MNIKILENKDESKWDQFVKENDDSTFFHLTGWKNVIEKTYGYKSFYLFTEEYGEISGILPLFLVDGLIFGKRLVSIPYCPYGGCCAKNQESKDDLITRAIELSKEFNAKYLELRNRENILGMPTNDRYATMIVNLTKGEDAVWSNIRKGMKACVKSAAREDFNITWDSKNVREFYSLYCRRIHELGTPVPPLSFFQNMIDNFPDTSIVSLVHNGEILASQVLLYFKKTVIYCWGTSSKRHWKYHPVHILLWNSIQKSIVNGYELFDFGRSVENSGTYIFKRRWGAEPQTLNYQYFLNKEKKVPYIHPMNSSYKIAIKVWQCLPLRVANWLGPHLSKEII